MTTTRTILVTGATGQQGGAVARALLRRGHGVRFLTRRPDSEAAAALVQLGAQPVAGDLTDPAALAQALQGVDAVFGVTTFFEAGVAAEVRQGKALGDAVKAAGVPHLVYTSVGGADQVTGIPHFDSKHEVERHLAAIGVPHTVIGPVFFMENLLAPWMLPGLQQGALGQALPPGRSLQLVAVADIGEFAALCLVRPEEFRGQRIDIASDERTGEDMARVLGQAAGREIRYSEVPLQALRGQSEEMATMYEWFDRVGYQADIAGLRQRYPEVGWHRLEDWAAKQDWSALR